MITRNTFGRLPDGTSIELITVRNAAGLQLRVATYGCIIVSLEVPDRAGHSQNVVLGYDRLEQYVESSPYFGALVGRYANRIANAAFSINGRRYQLSENDSPNHVHGGFKGFDKQVWDAEVAADESAVIFKRTSADGEEGFPGTLDVEVRYALGAGAELSMACEATTDAPTHVNLTQHSYFNLRGSGDVLSYRLMIQAARYLPVNDRLIPTGDRLEVANTPFDFREPGEIGERLRRGHEQLKAAGGYDHTFILDGVDAGRSPSARVFDPVSGRALELRTSEPGLQFYSGQVVGHRGLCLEPQHFPDTPNRPEFPPTLLRPGERYRTTTMYSFRS